jgi:hypothetical protein
MLKGQAQREIATTMDHIFQDLFRVAPAFLLLAAEALPASAQSAAAPSAAACALDNGIQHVIFVEFDNVHFRRDRPNVPSDLEQMPHLLSFIQDNGTLLTNNHTVLISHTAGGILSSLTGLYPDRHGATVTNSYGWFSGLGATGVTFGSAFKYWTDLVDDRNSPALDPRPNMIAETGKTTPAPWVPYTRAGCDVGGAGLANIELENTGTGPAGDMTTVFGQNSPEWNEARSNPSLAQTEFVGIAVHCAAGGGICARPTNGAASRDDTLPDEPGGYHGYKALFGAKYVNPALTDGQPAVKDVFGQNDITDARGNPGFPGFDGMLANNTLGHVAAMQEAGIPVTFAYISDAHDNHTLGRASGPGEADYVAQLAAYDAAFATFFDRLARHGITRQNTLFMFTADEGDHFVGGNSTDGTWSHTFCNVSAGQTCPPNQLGEVTANIAALLPADPARPLFASHSDSAPNFYVKGQPARNAAAVRQLERDVAAARAVDPYLSSSPRPIMRQMADPVEERILHMVNADPLRTPTFTMFANPEFFVTTGDTNCPTTPAAVCVNPGFAWNHGDIQPDIATTFLGVVGPGVRHLGRNDRVWADHADERPTILSLVGLHDDYVPDGRVLVELLDHEREGHRRVRQDQFDTDLRELGTIYKRLNAPFGPFSMDTLAVSTAAVASGSASDDSRYERLENQLGVLGSRRDALAARMRTALNDAEFGGHDINRGATSRMITEAAVLLAEARALARLVSPHAIDESEPGQAA